MRVALFPVFCSRVADRWAATVRLAEDKEVGQPSLHACVVGRRDIQSAVDQMIWRLGGDLAKLTQLDGDVLVERGLRIRARLDQIRLSQLSPVMAMRRSGIDVKDEDVQDEPDDRQD